MVDLQLLVLRHEFSWVTLSSSGRTQFFGATACFSVVKLSGNEDIDISGMFGIILVVNPTRFTSKDKVEPT